jgi:hypothetical protein
MSNTTRALLKLKRDSVAPVSVATAARTITPAEANRGIYVSNIGATGEVIFSLPAAVVGMRVNAIVGAAQLLSLDPVDGDIIHGVAGVAQTEDVAIKANAVGETIQLVCLQTGKWFVAAYTGTWSTTAA